MKHSWLRREYPDLSKIKHYEKSKNYNKKFAYLFSQHKDSRALQKHELEIWGIPQMVHGLCYHFKRFKNFEKAQDPRARKMPLFDNIVHEVTAYFNRLGQFYTLIKSKWFQDYVTEDTLPLFCPSALALIPYRHKVFAHRALDWGRGESRSQLESYSNITLCNTWTGTIGHPNMHISYQIKIPKDHRCTILAKHHKTPIRDYEHFTDNDEIFIDFVPIKHHDRLVFEIFETVKKLFDKF